MSSSEFEFNVFKLGLEGARKQEEIDRKNLRFYAAKMERERIIKLLEADICPDWTIDCCDGACSAYNDAINLIKGEQK